MYDQEKIKIVIQSYHVGQKDQMVEQINMYGSMQFFVDMYNFISDKIDEYGEGSQGVFNWRTYAQISKAFNLIDKGIAFTIAEWALLKHKNDIGEHLDLNNNELYDILTKTTKNG